MAYNLGPIQPVSQLNSLLKLVNYIYIYKRIEKSKCFLSTICYRIFGIKKNVTYMSFRYPIH